MKGGDDMELAKITSKGQITIPIEIRRRYGLHEGSKVLFVEEGNRVYLMNATMVAIREAQTEFLGVAEEAGLYGESDVVDMMKDFRKKRAEEK